MTYSNETTHVPSKGKNPLEPTLFASFGLAEPLLNNVTSLGFTAATPVQAQVIPAAMSGGDWLVSSQTGSGKTAAFLLPLLHQLVHLYLVAHNRRC